MIFNINMHYTACTGVLLSNIVLRITHTGIAKPVQKFLLQ